MRKIMIGMLPWVVLNGWLWATPESGDPVTPGTQVKIADTSWNRLSGTVVAIDGPSRTVQVREATGGVTQFTYDGSVQVMANGRVIPLEGLKPGDLVTAVRLESKKVTGSVESINNLANTFQVKDTQSAMHEFLPGGSLRVLRWGQSVTVKDLHVGDPVTVFY